MPNSDQSSELEDIILTERNQKRQQYVTPTKKIVKQSPEKSKLQLPKVVCFRDNYGCHSW